jgi:IS4 transposase
VRETYRQRFGIESSYRQMNQGRIRTCSRDPALRLLFAGIALILRNAWVLLHRTLLADRHGPHLRIHLERLRLATLLLHLQRHAEALLGIADPWSWTCPVPPFP